MTNEPKAALAIPNTKRTSAGPVRDQPFGPVVVSTDPAAGPVRDSNGSVIPNTKRLAPAKVQKGNHIAAGTKSTTGSGAGKMGKGPWKKGSAAGSSKGKSNRI
jgi:hypothetical protein